MFLTLIFQKRLICLKLTVLAVGDQALPVIFENICFVNGTLPSPSAAMYARLNKSDTATLP